MNQIKEISPKLIECTKLYDKANELKENEYLFTTFGPDNTYTIEKANDTLILKIWDCYHTFSRKPKEIKVITSPEYLVNWLAVNPQHYAQNVFTKTLIHFDNWVNLIRCFKVREYKPENKHTK